MPDCFYAHKYLKTEGPSLCTHFKKALLEAFAEKNGFTGIRHFTDDGISGTTFDRPGLQALLAEVEQAL